MNFFESLGAAGSHPIIIRPPHPAELEHVAALHQMVLPSKRPLSEILAKVHRHDAIQMSAFDGDKMVATVSLAPIPGQHYVYEVDRLVTLPQFRGQGIGTKVLEAAEKLAAERGAKTLVLDARPNAQRFFADRGYVPHHPGGAADSLAKQVKH